tara:strand:+ start:4152 stop:5657 length:1506 start_codon:yes stop_codon:yes gene_type:complete
MTQEKLMPWRHSLVFKIVGTTVFVYFLVTLVITAFQMSNEYTNTKSRVFNEVKIASDSIKSPLVEAMWNLDEEVINRIVSGLVKNPSVSGAIAFNSESEESSRHASNNTSRKTEAKSSSSGDNPFNLKNPIRFNFELTKDDKMVGRLDVYTSDEIIWEQLIGGFSHIVFNKVIEIVVLILVLLVLCLRILRPLKVLMVSVNDLSLGNLATKVNHESKDEFGHLSNSFNLMTQQLSGIIKTISDVSTNVATGSVELRATSSLVSEGGSTQASSVEETSTAIADMADAINDNSQRAKETEAKAELVADESKKCLEAVQRTTDSMKDISERITIVEEITKKIDLLALNASVEAARAGEHGKGFAVVASEVSKLADMSKQSSSEILRAASESRELAEATSAMLANLLPEIETTKDLVVSISATTGEQNTGASQINHSMQHLDKSVQNSASAALQMSQMSESLEQQAINLQQAINYFRFNENEPEGTSISQQILEATPVPLQLPLK